jgi:hypothetical protein
VKFFVVNVRYYIGPTVYCGRAGRGREGPLGNPFTKEEHGERALDLFDAWFDRTVVEDAAYRGMLEKLVDGPRALA